MCNSQCGPEGGDKQTALVCLSFLGSTQKPRRHCQAQSTRVAIQLHIVPSLQLRRTTTFRSMFSRI